MDKNTIIFAPKKETTIPTTWTFETMDSQSRYIKEGSVQGVLKIEPLPACIFFIQTFLDNSPVMLKFVMQ